jgi:hypothetical protein
MAQQSCQIKAEFVIQTPVVQISLLHIAINTQNAHHDTSPPPTNAAH